MFKKKRQKNENDGNIKLPISGNYTIISEEEMYDVCDYPNRKLVNTQIFTSLKKVAKTTIQPVLPRVINPVITK